MTPPAIRSEPAPAPEGAVRPTSQPGGDPRLRAWVAFLRAHAAIVRRLEAELEAETNLSMAEYDALVQLAAADQRRLRMSELADRVVLSRSGISRLVDRLEARGWVKRTSCPTDARGVWAILTPVGLDTLREATPVHLRGIERHFLRPMDDADREALARALEKVEAWLHRPDSGPGADPEPAASDVGPTSA